LISIAWKESLTSQKRDIIQSSIDHLDFINEKKRIEAAKCLAYISLGNKERKNNENSLCFFSLTTRFPIRKLW
jgi:hypothetical protein